MQYFIGIDAGGTSVRINIIRPGLATIQATMAAHPEGIPPLQLRDIVAGHPARAVCAGITKYTRSGIRDAWEQFLREVLPEAVVSVVPDYEIAFHAVLTDGNGIIVIAGTGSVAYGENISHNRQLRVGGRGWEWGDEGSGAWLTTEMIRRTLRALDGMSVTTPLTEAVCRLLETTEPAALAAVARERASTEGEGRGFLLPLLAERLRAEDGEAKDFFIGAGGWLSALAGTTANRLGFTKDQPLTIGITGGVWKAGGETVHKAFTNALRRRFENISLLESSTSPVEGAVRLAAKLIRHVDR